MNKFTTLAIETTNIVQEYNTYIDELLPKIAEQLKTLEVLAKYGYDIEVIRTYNKYNGFSVILVNKTTEEFVLDGGGYVLTLKVNEDGKLQATQANIVDFTLEELMEIQNSIVEVINSN